MGSIKPVKFRDRGMVRDGLLYPSAGALLARAIKVSIGLAQLLCEQTTIFLLLGQPKTERLRASLCGNLPQKDHREGSFLLPSFYCSSLSTATQDNFTVGDLI